jgi:hypothetical protein
LNPVKNLPCWSLNEEEGGTTKKAKRSSSLLAYQAEEALRRAVAEAIDEHRRNGVPIAIWRNGRVVRIYADEAAV